MHRRITHRGGYPGISRASTQSVPTGPFGPSWAGGRCAFGAGASVGLRLVARALEGMCYTYSCVEVNGLQAHRTKQASSAGAGSTDIGVNVLIVGIGIEATEC